MSHLVPAWPRRPPLWTTLACLLSIVLAVAYCEVARRSESALQKAFLPTYLQAAIWSTLPPAPSFRKNALYARNFTLPNHASITLPPRLLYRQLQVRVFDGQPIHTLFANALAAALSTSLLLVVVGASLDRSWNKLGPPLLEHLSGHQAVLRLLLPEGVEPAARAEGAEKAEAVGRVHVVALASDPDQPDRAWGVARADVRQIQGPESARAAGAQPRAWGTYVGYPVLRQGPGSGDHSETVAGREPVPGGSA